MNLAEMLAMADEATQGIEIASGEFELLKPGIYDFQITNAEGPKESARTNPSNPAEHGQYLKLEATVTGPNYIGRKIWFNNNILCYPKSTSAEDCKKAQTAMAMGAKERKVLLDSLNRTGIQAVQELIGATFKGSVVISKGTNGYKDKNDISSIKPLNSASSTPMNFASPAPVATPTISAPTSPTTPAARPKMPWEK